MVATSFDSAKEMVEKMLNGGAYVNGEWFEENCGEAYLDWGRNTDIYQNVSCKYFADEVARYFQKQGYFVYYNLMGWGKGDIPEYTPTTIRISKKPKKVDSYRVPFEG